SRAHRRTGREKKFLRKFTPRERRDRVHGPDAVPSAARRFGKSAVRVVSRRAAQGCVPMSLTNSEAEAALAAEKSAAVPDTHPKGFWFIFWGEFAERSSYYGMRAILPLYMTAQLLMPDAQATAWYSYFKMACYLLPLLGGFLADRYFGKY